MKKYNKSYATLALAMILTALAIMTRLLNPTMVMALPNHGGNTVIREEAKADSNSNADEEEEETDDSEAADDGEGE